VYLSPSQRPIAKRFTVAVDLREGGTTRFGCQPAPCAKLNAESVRSGLLEFSHERAARVVLMVSQVTVNQFFVDPFSKPRKAVAAQ
jgi:hypothetical protein